MKLTQFSGIHIVWKWANQVQNRYFTKNTVFFKSYWTEKWKARIVPSCRPVEMRRENEEKGRKALD